MKSDWGRRWLQMATITVVVLSACSSGSSTQPDTTSDETDGPSNDPVSETVESLPDFRIGEVAGPFRVVYLLDDLSDPAVEPSTDVLTVVPPFVSRLDTFEGPPPGGDLIGVQVASRDRLRVGNPDEPLVVTRVPRPGPSDLRVASVLQAGLDAGRLEMGEQRIVTGRRCQVIRSGTLLGSGPLEPIGETEFAETCVDTDGLVLEETLHVDGRPTLHRLAVEVDLEPDLSGVDLDPGEPTAPVDQGGGATLVADPASAPEGDFWTVPQVPPGFVHTARLSVIPPQPDQFAEPERPGVIAPTVDLYERGTDVIVVSQGATRGGVDVFEPDPRAERIEIEPFGEGDLLLDANGTELRFALEGGAFVHLIGTIAPDDLVDLARTLELTQGMGLVFVEDD